MKDLLILGGGYAGVSAAVRLAGVGAKVTLVNRHSYHHLTTLLHQPVVGRRGYTDLSVELKEVLPADITFVRGIVRTLAPAEKRVEIQTRHHGMQTLGYDALVIALGWEPQFFNIPGLREHALTLQNLNTSRLAKDRIEESLIAYDENPAETWRTSIVIGGGGLAGVELAGELAESRRGLGLQYDLHPNDIRIILVEGAPTLLHGMDPWLAERTTAYLQSKGVHCLTDTRITEVKANGVVLSDGKVIEAGAVIWTGGVRGNALVEQSGFTVNKQGRAEVDAFLRPAGYPEVHVIGDCALIQDDAGNPLPPTAQLAVQQGQWLAAHVRRQLTGQPTVPYRPKMMGIVLSLGRRYALGVVADRRLSGKPAGMLKDLIAYRYVYLIGGLGLALKKFWEWGPYAAAMRRP